MQIKFIDWFNKRSSKTQLIILGLSVCFLLGFFVLIDDEAYKAAYKAGRARGIGDFFSHMTSSGPIAVFCEDNPQWNKYYFNARNHDCWAVIRKDAEDKYGCKPLINGK